jgi:hypothetical protein
MGERPPTYKKWKCPKKPDEHTYVAAIGCIDVLCVACTKMAGSKKETWMVPDE